MSKKVIVLGCGLIGKTLAQDLAADPDLEVSVADVSRADLDRLADTPNLRTIQTDLASPDSVTRLVADYDLVAGAMPSTMGLQTLRAVIEAGKPFADISFMAEDPMQFADLAKRRGVTVVFDCGVAPGLANMIIGHCHAELDETTNVAYYVGGLPKERTWPHQYKAPFAPADVIEEYTRPARLIEDGRIVVKPALSEPETIDLPRVGTLEAFNTDGLRSLLGTISARNMKEKTLRYPGHCQLMRAFRDTGLFSKETIEVAGVRVCPLDVTSKLLFPQWKLAPGEPEFTVLRVIVEGRTGRRAIRHTYDLYDEYDPATGHHSMARTTAFPCAIVARMIATGEFDRPGVHPPEVLGAQPGTLDRIIEALAARNVHIESRQETIDP